MTTICPLSHRRNPDQPRELNQGYYICRACQHELARLLIGQDYFTNGTRDHVPGLGELYHQLGDNLAPSSGQQGERHSGSKDRPLPFNSAVSQHRADIEDIVRSWATLHTLAPNTTSAPASIDPLDVCRWLEVRVDYAATQDWAVDYVTELRQLRGKAHALLDPVRRTRFVIGTCNIQGCEGWLVADIATNDPLLPAVIYCDHEPCSAEWPPHRWIELGRLLGADKPKANGEAA